MVPSINLAVSPAQIPYLKKYPHPLPPYTYSMTRMQRESDPLFKKQEAAEQILCNAGVTGDKDTQCSACLPLIHFSFI